jgi:hypothetical protein
LGLEFGLRFVNTEYVVICDPDSVILSERFWPLLRDRVQHHGGASIDIGSPAYHPMCMAFRTELWKNSHVSMREDWATGRDVGEHITRLVGGIRDEALLARTRSAGPPIKSTRPGKYHYVGEVYAEAFSNTSGASRALEGAGAFGAEEGSFDDIVGYHERWRAWRDRYLEGSAGLDDFPRT